MNAPNILIRQSEVSDAEAIHRINTAPKAVWGTLQVPYTSVEKYRKRIAERPEGRYHLLAVVDDEPVGNLGLGVMINNPRRSHVGEIGMSVRDDWQGKGVGTALMQGAVDLADKWLNLKRLELTVFTDNPAALALYTKFGFEKEGILRGYAFRDGVYVDAYTMARMRV